MFLFCCFLCVVYSVLSMFLVFLAGCSNLQTILPRFVWNFTNMGCLYKSCLPKIGSGSDRYVPYRLCDRFEYPKCGGVSERVPGAVLDFSKCLRCSFPDCKEQNKAMCHLFVQTKMALSETDNELSSLSSKLDKYKPKFGKRSCLSGEGPTCSVAFRSSPFTLRELSNKHHTSALAAPSFNLSPTEEFVDFLRLIPLRRWRLRLSF